MQIRKSDITFKADEVRNRAFASPEKEKAWTEALELKQNIESIAYDSVWLDGTKKDLLVDTPGQVMIQDPHGRYSAHAGINPETGRLSFAKIETKDSFLSLVGQYPKMTYTETPKGGGIGKSLKIDYSDKTAHFWLHKPEPVIKPFPQGRIQINPDGNAPAHKTAKILEKNSRNPVTLVDIPDDIVNDGAGKQENSIQPGSTSGEKRAFREISGDEADSYLRENWSQWFDSLTEEENKAYYDYTAFNFPEINRYLRGTYEGDPQTVDECRHLKNAMDKGAVPDDIVVWRGTLNIPKIMEQIEEHGPESLVGKVYTEKGFLSTSVDRETGDKYACNILFKINVPKGSKAISGIFSRLPCEKELIFPPDSRMKITSVGTKPIYHRNVLFIEADLQNNQFC